MGAGADRQPKREYPAAHYCTSQGDPTHSLGFFRQEGDRLEAFTQIFHARLCIDNMHFVSLLYKLSGEERLDKTKLE